MRRDKKNFTREITHREMLCSSSLHEVCLVLFAEGGSPVLQYGEVFVSNIEDLVQQFG